MTALSWRKPRHIQVGRKHWPACKDLSHVTEAISMPLPHNVVGDYESYETTITLSH